MESWGSFACALRAKSLEACLRAICKGWPNTSQSGKACLGSQTYAVESDRIAIMSLILLATYSTSDHLTYVNVHSSLSSSRRASTTLPRIIVDQRHNDTSLTNLIVDVFQIIMVTGYIQYRNTLSDGVQTPESLFPLGIDGAFGQLSSTYQKFCFRMLLQGFLPILGQPGYLAACSGQ